MSAPAAASASTRDDRKSHMHVIGSSGSGKAKFLEWMIRGDHQNRHIYIQVEKVGYQQ